MLSRSNNNTSTRTTRPREVTVDVALMTDVIPPVTSVIPPSAAVMTRLNVKVVGPTVFKGKYEVAGITELIRDALRLFILNGENLITNSSNLCNGASSIRDKDLASRKGDTRLRSIGLTRFETLIPIPQEGH